MKYSTTTNQNLYPLMMKSEQNTKFEEAKNKEEEKASEEAIH